MYYGLTNTCQVKSLARLVVSALGGGDKAFNLLVETASAETLLGTFPDVHPDKLGVGLCQHDQIGLDDIQRNSTEHFDKVKSAFGYDLASIRLAKLADDPLLSLICCRLTYKRVPAAIPNDLFGRALYWKEYYNTHSGKGSPEEYIHRVRDCLGEQWA